MDLFEEMTISQRLTARWCTITAVFVVSASAALAQGHQPSGFMGRELSALFFMVTHFPSILLVLVGIPALSGYCWLVARRMRPDSKQPEEDRPPQSSVPEGLSPFIMTTVNAMDDGGRVLMAAIVGLAVKGYCIIRAPRPQSNTDYRILRQRDFANYPYQTIIGELLARATVSFEQLAVSLGQPEREIRKMVDFLMKEGLYVEKTDDKVQLISITREFPSRPYGLSIDEYNVLRLLIGVDEECPLNIQHTTNSVLWITCASMWHASHATMQQFQRRYFVPGVLFAGLALWEVVRISRHYLAGIDVQRVGASLLMIGLPLCVMGVLMEGLWTEPFSGDMLSRTISWVKAILVTICVGMLVVIGNVLYYVMPFSLLLIAAMYVAIIAGLRTRLTSLTEYGLRLRRELADFRQFLALPFDESSQSGMPERTISQFERYLPYAIALEVEGEWYRKFADLFENMAEQHPYQPNWYEGPDWRIFLANGFDGATVSFIDNFPAWRYRLPRWR